MGIVVAFHCAKCGYASPDLKLGPAPHLDEFDPVLVSCAKCRDLTSVHRPDVRKGCGEHRVKYRVFRRDRPVPCPRCRATLVEQPSAIWD